jgi:O-antigen ligase
MLRHYGVRTERGLLRRYLLQSGCKVRERPVLVVERDLAVGQPCPPLVGAYCVQVCAGSSYNCCIPQRFCLASLAAILAYAVYEGGAASSGWNICLLALGLAAAVFWLRTPAEPGGTGAPWLLLFPCYVVLQLLPLPLFLLRLLSPTRANVLDSLARLMPPAGFAPLAIAPAITVAHLLRIVAYVLLFALVCDLARLLPGRGRWLAAAPLVAIAAVEAGLGLLQNAQGAAVQGTYVNKNHFAGLLEMALPLAAAYAAALFARRSHAKAAGMLSIGLLIFAGLVCSLSKMGFAAGLAGLFVMGALGIAGKVQGRGKWLAVAGLAALLLFGFVFLPSDAFVANYGGLTSKGPAALEGRGPIWRETLHLIAAYPVFGCGLGNYETAFLRYQTSVVDRVFTYAHNDYLQVAAELGAAGFLIAAALLLPVFARPFRAAAQGPDRSTRYLGLGCAGGIAAMGLHSLTDFNMYVPANALALAWICGIGTSLPLAGTKPGEKPAPDRHRALFRRFAIGLAYLLIVYAPVRMVFDSQFRSDSRTESLFCRFGICDTDAVMTAQTLAYGGNAADVPPAELFKALRRDSNAPARWCDTGEAMQRAGRDADAEYCFSQAQVLGPHIPPILMQAADFYYETRRTDRAFERMARVLADTDTYDGVIFGWYAQKKLPVSEVLAHGLPPGPRAADPYMRDLIAGDSTGTKEAWLWITARSLGDGRLAREYLEYLFGKRDYQAAAYAWKRYLGPRANGYLEYNWVFNGDFESGISDSPFDWRINVRDGVSAAEDTQVAHTGSRSLRIHFEGKENLEYNDVGQVAFVKPGRYRFEAYVRSDGITTDKGIGFHIYDRESGSRLDVRTEELTGTHDWTRLDRIVSVPAGTRLLEIEVSRQRSLKFDNQIGGTVWIDSVELSPLDNPR